MKKLMIVFLCCTILLMSYCVVENMKKNDAEILKKENNDQRISLDETQMSGMVYACYDKGYTSVEDLLDDATLIVRATPIAIEYESDVAICWVLRIEESNREGLEVIRLRQLKDEHFIKMGQEVVLALQQDAGEGYYNIPGG